MTSNPETVNPKGRSLTEFAMIVRLSVTQWTARKYDKKVSAEIAANHNTDDTAGRYNKVLVAQESLKKIQSIVSAARNFNYENTLPWTDEGARILPALNYDHYMMGIKKFQREFEREVELLVSAYPQLVDDARLKLRSMFNIDDYPPADVIRHRYTFDWTVTPVPTGGDFRVVGVPNIDDIKKDIEARVASAQADALKDIWARLSDVIGRVVERLDNEDNIFRNSLVDNVESLCELIPRLNIAGDPVLDAFAKEARAKLAKYPPETLRDNKLARKEVADSAKDLFSQISKFI